MPLPAAVSEPEGGEPLGDGQEDFLADKERWLLSLGVRADQSSLNADASQLFWYPKAATSYRFVKPAGFLDELKLRVAYGESGLEPDYGQKFTPLDASQNIGGLPTIVVLGTIGAPDLHPEREREIEGGFDAYLWNQTATEFSVYQKNLTICWSLARRSSGHTDSSMAARWREGSKSRQRSADPEAKLQLAEPGHFLHTKSTITLDVPAFETGGFGTSIGAFKIERAPVPLRSSGTTPPTVAQCRSSSQRANPKFRIS
jgi:hypothetical protein